MAVDLPPEAAWRLAVGRAASILGLAAVNPALNPSSVEKLADELRAKGAALLPAAEAVVPLLEQRLSELGADAATAHRVRTAVAARELAQGLAGGGDPVAVIERFAEAEVPTTEQALGTGLAAAGATMDVLDAARWQILLLVAQRARSSEQAHQRIVDELARALSHDEFAEPLAPAVERASTQGMALLAEANPQPEPEPVGAEAEPQPEADPPGASRGGLTAVTVEDARRKLDELGRENGSVRVDLAWTITTNDAGR